MKLIKNFVLNILISSAMLYIIANYIPELGLMIKSEYNNDLILFGTLGVIFWFVMSLLRRAIQLLALPAKYLTLGISSLIINMFMFYFFEQFINYLDVGIEVTLGTVIQTFTLSVIITSLYVIIRKII